MEQPPNATKRALVLPPLPADRQHPACPESAPSPSAAPAAQQTHGGGADRGAPEPCLLRAARVKGFETGAAFPERTSPAGGGVHSPGLGPRHGGSPSGRQVSMVTAMMRGSRASRSTARRLESAFGDSRAEIDSRPPGRSAGCRDGAHVNQDGTQGNAEEGLGLSVHTARVGVPELPSYLQQALGISEGGIEGPAAAAAAVAHSEYSSRAAPERALQAAWDGSAAVGMAQSSGAQPLRTDAYAERLPPMSQLDASVLDALPLHVKRELEMAYGAHFRPKFTSLLAQV